MWRPSNPACDWLTERPIAHRGLHDKKAGCEENSLEAFAAAITHGYAIECDLQLSADGEAMVFHDDTLDRLTSETGRVDARTAAQLQEISYATGRGAIPALSQLLDLAGGDAGLVLELKSHWDGDTRLAARVAELVSRYDGPVAIMSFDPRADLTLQEATEAELRFVSGIVRSPFGFHIIEITDRRQEPVKSFEEAAPGIRAQLREESLQREMATWMNQLRKKAYVKIFIGGDDRKGKEAGL